MNTFETYQTIFLLSWGTVTLAVGITKMAMAYRKKNMDQMGRYWMGTVLSGIIMFIVSVTATLLYAIIN